MTDKVFTIPDETMTEQDVLREALMDELRRLVSCYQIASRDDKAVVWAALNKYLPLI